MKSKTKRKKTEADIVPVGTILDELDAIQIPDFTKSTTATSYDTIWQTLHQVDDSVDQVRGFAHWLQGEILLNLKKDGHHGEFEAAVKRFKISPAEAWRRREYRKVIPRRDARKIGLTEMRNQIEPNKRKGRKTQTPNIADIPLQISEALDAIRKARETVKALECEGKADQKLWGIVLNTVRSTREQIKSNFSKLEKTLIDKIQSSKRRNPPAKSKKARRKGKPSAA